MPPFTWASLLLVGLGGALGSMARYAAGLLAQRWPISNTLPLGTILVNGGGCLAIGFLGGTLEKASLLSAPWRAFVFVGFLGGFTTFSTFGYETLVLLRNDRGGLALLNVLVQVLGGLLLAWLGYFLSRLT